MDISSLASTASGLNDLYSQYQSYQNANNTGNQVNNLLGQQQNLYGNQAAQSANQIGNINQQYGNLYGLQQGLTLGNIDQLQSQLNPQHTQNLQNTALNAIGDQRNGLQGLMGQWQSQINNSSAQGQDLFNEGLGAIRNQYQGYQDDITRQTDALNQFTDPNSSYMQMARQAIERKDAAAGRRSQWGDREVQLAGLMAENYGKYAPALQQGIQNSRNAMTNDLTAGGNLFNQLVNNPNQINQGLQGLLAGGYGQLTKDLQAGADIYNTLGQSQDRTNALLSQQIGGMGQLGSLLNGQFGNLNSAINGMGNAAQGLGTAAGNANTTGRQAGYSSNNQLNQLLNGGIGALSKLFGGDSGSSGGISDLGGLMGQLGSGLGDWGSSLSNDWFGGSGSLGFDLGSLFGSGSISGGDGIGYGYDGVAGGITSLMDDILGD